MMPATPDAPSTDRLVVLHGFTQTHHHSRRLALDLASRTPFSTITLPDLPGHGLSAADRADFMTTAAALPTRCGPGTYVGYSMGGRFALAAATERPDLVRRLILIGASAGLDDAADRRARRALDAERADRVQRIGVDAFLDEWLAAPMFAELPDDPADLDARRRNSPDGLAHSLRTCGTGNQPSLWGRVHEITAPVLVLAGSRDEKFIEIGRRLAGELVHAQFAVIGDAGHAAHIEQPEATATVMTEWLSST